MCGRRKEIGMRPNLMSLLALTGALALAGTSGAFASTKHHHHYARYVHRYYAPRTVYSSDEPPLTVNKRSWLDPGNVVPQGSEQNYVTANTSFNETPDEAYFPSRFEEDNLPRPLYPTGTPHPVLNFWTPGYQPYP
jgi:hypothetical protein